jgi:hypothetical protein
MRKLFSQLFVVPIALAGLAGCGPLFDHQTRAKPQMHSASPEEKSSTPSSAVTYQLDLSSSASVSVQIVFTETPRFKASLHQFSASLEVWDPQTMKKIELSSLPLLSFQNPEQCCFPPPPVITRTAAGVYSLTGIEFHATGPYDFFVLIQIGSETFHAQTVIHVADS